MENIVNELARLKLTISSCESITGGWFAKIITDIAGVSTVFKGSIIAYSDEVKINVVKIDKEIIKKFGVISPECATAMAINTRHIFKSDISISFTGNAGPINLEEKPLGLVYIAISFSNNFLVKEFSFTGNREEVRFDALTAGLKFLKDNLMKIKKELLL